jgi:hypothetical protein
MNRRYSLSHNMYNRQSTLIPIHHIPVIPAKIHIHQSDHRICKTLVLLYTIHIDIDIDKGNLLGQKHALTSFFLNYQ